MLLSSDQHSHLLLVTIVVSPLLSLMVGFHLIAFEFCL